MEPKYTPLTNEQEVMLKEVIDSFSMPLIGPMVVARSVKEMMEGSAKALMAPISYIDGLLANLPKKDGKDEELDKAIDNSRILLETLKEDRATFIAHLQAKGFDGEFMA